MPPGDEKKGVQCPDCEGVLDIAPDELEEGDQFTCDECGVTIEVVKEHPLKLVAVSDEDVDDGDDDE